MHSSFRVASFLVGLLTASTAAAVTPDHLQCFKIKDVVARATYSATITPSDDTFPAAVGCTIKVPAKMLCVDAVKSNVSPAPPGSAEGPAAQQYLCYKTKCPASEPTGKAVDQFGTHTLTVKSTGLVCAPLASPIHCLDLALSSDESDIDCGGSCAACGTGQDCTGGADCASGVCAMGSCQAPTCSDSVHNGAETDVDCGGTCGGCATGEDCALAGDCASGVCSSGVCQAPGCADSVRNGSESDTDCGGTCPDCGLTQDCGLGTDCASGYCSAGACQLPNCADSVRNGDESDIDCGGSCATCALTRSCGDDGDCASGVCDSAACASCAANADCAPTAFCSSGSCVPTLGAACASAATCPSGFCVDGVCCDTACGSTCEACTYIKNLTSDDGTCAPIASGIDPDSECAGTGACASGICGPAVVAGVSSTAILRSDSCSDPTGRKCESLIGDVVTDSVRLAYAADFALTSSGALRADLSCPAAGNTQCDAYSPPPHTITAGEVLAVDPFGDRVTTVTVTGDVLKAMLENAVSLSPAVASRYAQVSGLCFTYDVAMAAGSRVTGAMRQAGDGSCTGAAVNLTVGASYLIAENNFMAGGGDGYPNLLAGSTLQDSVWQAVNDHVTAATPLSPVLQGRVACIDSNGATAPNCPL